MTHERRELMLLCMDSERENPQMHYALHMCSQFYRCNDMIVWLIRNRLTGKNLLEWIRFEHGGSNFQMAKYVLTKVKREKLLQPVIAGQDFIIKPGRA